MAATGLVTFGALDTTRAASPRSPAFAPPRAAPALSALAPSPDPWPSAPPARRSAYGPGARW